MWHKQKLKNLSDRSINCWTEFGEKKYSHENNKFPLMFMLRRIEGTVFE